MFKFLSPLKTFLILKIIQDEINLNDLYVSDYSSPSLMLCHETLDLQNREGGIEVKVLDHKIKIGLKSTDEIWNYKTFCYSADINYQNLCTYTNRKNCCKYINMYILQTDILQSESITYQQDTSYSALIDLNGSIILFGNQDKYYKPMKIVNNKYIIISHQVKDKVEYYMYSTNGNILWSSCFSITDIIKFEFFPNEGIYKIDSEYFLLLGTYRVNGGKIQDISIQIKESEL